MVFITEMMCLQRGTDWAFKKSSLRFVFKGLTSWFHGILLTYFLNDFDMVPVAPIITRITVFFTFHMRCISIVRSSFYYYY